MRPPVDVQKYLESERDRIQGEFAEILKKMRELELDRERLGNRLRALEDLLQDVPSEEETSTDSNPLRKAVIRTSRFENVGIRDAILMVVQENPSGISPIDIAAILKKQGLSDTGTTTIETRVSNEVYRLYKADRVRKLGRGLYAPFD